jgi:hypothetical protein
MRSLFSTTLPTWGEDRPAQYVPIYSGCASLERKIEKVKDKKGEFKVRRVKMEGKGSREEKDNNRVKEYEEQRILGSRRY